MMMQNSNQITISTLQSQGQFLGLSRSLVIRVMMDNDSTRPPSTALISETCQYRYAKLLSCRYFWRVVQSTLRAAKRSCRGGCSRGRWQTFLQRRVLHALWPCILLVGDQEDVSKHEQKYSCLAVFVVTALGSLHFAGWTRTCPPGPAVRCWERSNVECWVMYR